jgi:ABC-2 type transport system permease protein
VAEPRRESESAWATLARCLLLWGALVRNSLVRQLEFRANFVGRIAVEAIWMAAQVLTYLAAYRYAETLAGWNRAEMTVFLASLIISDGLFTILIYPNQNKFGQLLRTGQFDFYLLYPLPALFLSFFRFVNVHGLINVALGAGLLAWQMAVDPVALNWALWLLYLGLGFVAITCITIAVTAIGFWTTQTTNLVWLFFEIYRLGFRPENFYAPWMRRFLLSVFPAAFFFSVPVQLALGKLGGTWFAYPWLVTGATLAAVAWIWKRGLRLYEGALS